MPPAAAVPVLGVVLTVVAGIVGAIQSRANGTLGVALGDPLDATLWSFVSGWSLLTLAMLRRPSWRALALVRDGIRSGGLRVWMFVGGLIGGAFVAVQAYAVPLTGVALFLVCVVAGQTVGALAVDGVGFGPSGRAPVTATRVAAAVGTLAGVTVAVAPRLSAGGGPGIAAAVVLSFLVGAGTSVQTATNGLIQGASRSLTVTTWVNFTLAFGLILVITVGRLAFGTVHRPLDRPVPWWAWVGGLCGIVVVAVGSYAARRLGILLVILLMIAGQMAGGLLLDIVDAAARARITPLLVFGILLTASSAAFAAYAAQRAMTTKTGAGDPEPSTSRTSTRRP